MNENNKPNNNYLWDDSFDTDFLLQQTSATAWNNFISSEIKENPIVNNPSNDNVNKNINLNNFFNNNFDQDNSLANLSQQQLNIKNENIEYPIDIVGPACLINGDVIDIISNIENNNDHNPTLYINSNNNNIKFTKSAPNTPPNLSNININNNNNNENDSSILLTMNQNKSVPNSPNYLQVSWNEDQLSIPSTSPLSSPCLTSEFQFDNINNLDLENKQPQQQPQQQQPQQQQPQQQQQQQQKIQSYMFNNNNYSPYPYPYQYHHHHLQSSSHHPHKSSHNAVEKKYRNNINDKISELRDAVPALRHARIKKEQHLKQSKQNNMTDDDEENQNDEPIFMDGIAVANKLNKATILQKATEYIYHLQHQNQDLHQDIDNLLNMIMITLPNENGKNIIQQYKQFVEQRDLFQKHQLALKEKEKRLKKSLNTSNSTPSSSPNSISSSIPNQLNNNKSFWDSNLQQQSQQQDQSFLSPYNPSNSSPLVSNIVENNSQSRQQKYSMDIPY